MAVPRLNNLKKYFNKKNHIQEIAREPTAGGIIFRRNQSGQVEFLLAQDSRNRWTIPKGHIEEGETAKQTAKREIGEEVGLHNVEMICWLGKVHFRYRRQDRLVLMTTQIYLVKARGDTDAIERDYWMSDLKWLSFNQALEVIEYEDIGKLMLIAMKKIRQENL